MDYRWTIIRWTIGLRPKPKGAICHSCFFFDASNAKCEPPVLSASLPIRTAIRPPSELGSKRWNLLSPILQSLPVLRESGPIMPEFIQLHAPLLRALSFREHQHDLWSCWKHLSALLCCREHDILLRDMCNASFFCRINASSIK